MERRLISIIIIVKNDPRVLYLVKKILNSNSNKNIEIIVVDASDKKIMPPINKDTRVKWYFYNQKGKSKTISQQRNYGIKRSKGDVIVFIDADCDPVTDWLKSISDPILSKIELVTVGPIVVKGYMRHNKSSHYVRYAGGGNMAISREACTRVGYYNEDMSVAEDYEYCARIRQNGYKIALVDSAVVHHPNDSFKKNFFKGFIYGEGVVKLYIKNPSEIGLHSHFIYTVSYSGYILLLPLAYFFPYYPLLIAVPALIRLPRNPIKELINISFGFGVLYGCIKSIL